MTAGLIYVFLLCNKATFVVLAGTVVSAVTVGNKETVVPQ